MGLFDPAPYKVTNNVSSLDATTQDSMLDAITAVINALVNANIDPAAAIALSKLANYPAAAGFYAEGNGGWTRPPGSLIYRKTSTTDLVNSVVQTDLAAGALTIAANAMGANGIVKISAWGDYKNNTGSTQQISLGTTFGGVVVFLTTNFGITTSASRFPWNIQWWICNQGATNAQQQGGTLRLGIASTGSTAIPADAATMDTTSPVVAKILGQFAVADAQLSIRCHGALAQVFA